MEINNALVNPKKLPCPGATESASQIGVDVLWRWYCGEMIAFLCCKVALWLNASWVGAEPVSASKNNVCQRGRMNQTRGSLCSFPRSCVRPYCVFTGTRAARSRAAVWKAERMRVAFLLAVWLGSIAVPYVWVRYPHPPDPPFKVTSYFIIGTMLNDEWLGMSLLSGNSQNTFAVAITGW